MGSIYLIRNHRNGKCYVGQTIGDAAKDRIHKHLNGRGNQLIRHAIKKHGRDAFTFEILQDGVIPELLSIFEKEAIKAHNTVAPNGYNLTWGGEGCASSEETKRKISEAHKNSPRAIEHQKKLAETNKGRKRSEETKRKISEALKGKTKKPFSEEHCRKLSEANKGKPGIAYWKGKKLSPETRRKMSEVRKGRIFSKAHCRKISESKLSPERKEAYVFYRTLPSSMPIKEKRRHIRKLTGKSRTTVCRWVKQWENGKP